MVSYKEPNAERATDYCLTKSYLLNILYSLRPYYTVVEDEPIFVDDDHTIPAPADMVEWKLLTLEMGVVLPATLTLFWAYIQLYTFVYFIWTTLCISTLSIVGYCEWIRWIHPLSEGEGVRVQVWSGYKEIVAVWGYIYPLFIYIWVELYFILYTELPLYKWSGSFGW